LKHKNLEKTIAKNAELVYPTKISVMGCHEEDEEYCIGWLHNQLGSGNNIPLRISMMGYSNVGDIKVYGDQHNTFEDTLPK